MIRSCIALAVLCGPAMAQDTMNLSGTTISIQPSDRPGAVAEVVMDNITVNDKYDNMTFGLSMPGLSVEATFIWEYETTGADAVRVSPPEGVACLPSDCVLSVLEGAAGTLWLFSAEGVGM